MTQGITETGVLEGGANTHCLKTAVWLEKPRAWPSTEKHACRKQEHQNYNFKSRPQVSSQGVLRKSTQEMFHTRFLWLVSGCSGCSGFLSHFPDSCHLSCFISLFPTPLWAARSPGSTFPSPSTLSQVRFIPLNHLLPFILDFPCFYPPNITRMWPLLVIPTPSGAAHHHLLPRQTAAKPLPLWPCFPFTPLLSPETAEFLRCK